MLRQTHSIFYKAFFQKKDEYKKNDLEAPDDTINSAAQTLFLQDLPNEITANIIDFLDEKAMINFALTSKQSLSQVYNQLVDVAVEKDGLIESQKMAYQNYLNKKIGQKLDKEQHRLNKIELRKIKDKLREREGDADVRKVVSILMGCCLPMVFWVSGAVAQYLAERLDSSDPEQTYTKRVNTSPIWTIGKLTPLFAAIGIYGENYVRTLFWKHKKNQLIDQNKKLDVKTSYTLQK